MTIRISKEELLDFSPCDAGRRLALFGRKKYLTAKQALEAGATISDLLWVAGRLRLKKQCVQFALASAQRAVHLNSDPRVQAALDATQAWINNPTEENRAAARAAACAVEDTARAARAAAAAYAAAAAAYAVDTAAFAVDAAAAAAACAVEREAQIKLFLEIFK